MNILTILHSLIIGPLKLFFDVIFSVANRFLHHPGLSIIFLSLAMNFLVLPLYMRADALQEEEKEMEAKMKPRVNQIKAAFKGDERFMILQTYYRQVGYKQTDALKGSVSLLLEIPFFIAAYQFLSNLSILQGVSFGPILDLGQPDALITIGSLTINILPILMTVINFVSAAIYTKGSPLKNKIQIYGIAVIFLVLLYQSPSGLAFYWTLNNVFSLVKNIFYKLKHPGRVLAVLASICGLALLVFGIIKAFPTPKKKVFLILLGLAFQIPLVLQFINRHKEKKAEKVITITRQDKWIFFAGCIYLAIFVGLTISSGVISASPAEFVNLSAFKNPIWYAANSTAMAVGTFVVWFGIFYALAGNRLKKIMQAAIWILAVTCTVNYLFFGTKLGSLRNTLMFDVRPDYTFKQQMVNLIVICAVGAVAYLLYRWKSNIAQTVMFIGAAAMLIMGVYNIIRIDKEVAPLRSRIEVSNQDIAQIPLSRDGKNVIVMMLDRAIGQYIPYIMNEKPELKEKFSGFTYYANTMSYGGATNVGAPPLFGGYEYTPKNMNARSDEPLAEKHNEALRVMPVLFDENGYEVTVCDPPYANYDWVPDLTIYDDHPDIHTYITGGKFISISSLEQMEQLYRRNFFCYGIFKAAPVIFQEALYNYGTYNNSEFFSTGKGGSIGEQIMTSKYTAGGLSSLFLESYSVLENLTNITVITEKAENTFLMISNDTTHSQTLLQTPDYVPENSVDNTEYEEEHADRFMIDGRTFLYETDDQIMHYHVNMAAMLQLGSWFDYLKANGVYDNTRIILVSDHGFGLRQFPDLITDFGEDSLYFAPLLLVKDFGDREFTISYDFMTNGDVPALATEGIIMNPVNPFTGKNLQDTSAKNGKQFIAISDWHTDINNGNTFIDKGWISVHDNIYDMSNWVKE